MIRDVQEFADNIRELLADKSLSDVLRSNGRRLVEEQHDWRKIAQSMEGYRGVNQIKNILVVNDFPIYLPNHGGKIRIYNIYKYLSHFYRVVYVSFGSSDSRRKKHIS